MGPEERLTFAKELAEQSKKTEDAHLQTHELMRERKRIQKLMTVNGTKKQLSSKKRGRGKKKKTEMAQASLTQTAEKEKSGTNIEMTKVTEGAAEGMASGQWKTHQRSASFAKARDPKSGKDYYHNSETGESTWTLPAGAVLIDNNTKQ